MILVQFGRSSNIKSFTYDRHSQKLTVYFKSGGVYEYANVPAETVGAFAMTESPGSFFAKGIRPAFTTTKVLLPEGIHPEDYMLAQLDEPATEEVPA